MLYVQQKKKKSKKIHILHFTVGWWQEIETKSLMARRWTIGKNNVSYADKNNYKDKDKD